jgi:hypothetical protein
MMRESGSNYEKWSKIHALNDSVYRDLALMQRDMTRELKKRHAVSPHKQAIFERRDPIFSPSRQGSPNVHP